MTSQGHFKDWLKKEKSHDKEYKAFTMKNATQKSFLKASTPFSPLGEHCNTMCSILGERWAV
jgi:hypothetical protein